MLVINSGSGGSLISQGHPGNFLSSHRPSLYLPHLSDRHSSSHLLPQLVLARHETHVPRHGPSHYHPDTHPIRNHSHLLNRSDHHLVCLQEKIPAHKYIKVPRVGSSSPNAPRLLSAQAPFAVRPQLRRTAGERLAGLSIRRKLSRGRVLLGLVGVGRCRGLSSGSSSNALRCLLRGREWFLVLY